MTAATASFGVHRPLIGVPQQTVRLQDFRLESGQLLPEVLLAYETYGQLAADGRNGILIAHGYTSHHHAASCDHAAEAKPGWWERLIGPGRAIDTTRFFVVSSNMLGSCYGSTGPASPNPRTGRPYGPDFPVITMRDIVTAQRHLLERLGVRHLIAVAGPSMGGRQAFQWAVTFPDFVDGIVAVASSPKGLGKEDAVVALRQRLAVDPNWNNGWYYERGGVVQALMDIRIETLKRYGMEAVLSARYADPSLREWHLRRMAETWAREFDAHSLVVLRRASVHFDAQQHFSAINAKILYVISRSDRLFPPSMGQRVMERLRTAGVDATYVEIDTAYGHLASGREAWQWAPALQSFLARLIGA